MSKDDIVATSRELSPIPWWTFDYIDNLGRHGYYNGHRGQFFARAASLRSREYADAFLGGGFNYTSHAHTHPFGPAALLGQRWRRRRRRTRRACPKKSRSNTLRVIRCLLYARRRLSHYYFIIAGMVTGFVFFFYSFSSFFARLTFDKWDWTTHLQYIDLSVIDTRLNVSSRFIYVNRVFHSDISRVN